MKFFFLTSLLVTCLPLMSLTRDLPVMRTLVLPATGSIDTADLPYREIPQYPASFTAGNMVARVLDGLGFRYYWATNTLREADLDFKPSPQGRTSRETLMHIYELSMMIVNACRNMPMPQQIQPVNLSFVELRKATLENIRNASDRMKIVKEEDLSKYKIVFTGVSGNAEFPFWNLLNGPIDDALWHIGQVVTFRRSSGNPIDPKANVFTGRLDE